jgi:hypothetical protein
MPRIPIAMVGGALGLALLVGCESVDEIMGDRDDDDDGPRTVVFHCDDDREFSVRLSGDRDEARVDTGEQTYDLEQTGRDGDFRVYGNDEDVRLEISNEEARLRIPGAADFRDCERI